MGAPGKLMDLCWDEIHDAQKYALLANQYKCTNRELADLYFKLSGEEMDHMARLQAMAFRLLDQERNAGRDDDGKIQAVVEHLHCRNLDAAADVGIMQGLYRK
nr:MAG TPA: Rubrerythrin [Caudoviricetes sp.]DAM55826.1 MAG TPA: Rubrerythrin [Caudoviricetes sp.]